MHARETPEDRWPVSTTAGCLCMGLSAGEKAVLKKTGPAFTPKSLDTFLGLSPT